MRSPPFESEQRCVPGLLGATAVITTGCAERLVKPSDIAPPPLVWLYPQAHVSDEWPAGAERLNVPCTGGGQDGCAGRGVAGGRGLAAACALGMQSQSTIAAASSKRKILRFI